MARQKAKKANQAEVSRAINALRRMVRGLRAAAEAVERDLKISAAQLFVMTELSQSPEQSVKDLAAVTMTTHSTVSQVVSQLLAKRLVTRSVDPADARRSVLRLTRQGSNLLRRSPRAIQQDLIEGFFKPPKIKKGVFRRPFLSNRYHLIRCRLSHQPPCRTSSPSANGRRSRSSQAAGQHWLWP